MSKRFITRQETFALDGIFELSFNIFFFPHVSQACDPHPACAFPMYAFFGFPSTWLHSVCMLLAAIADMYVCMFYLKAGNGQVKMMSTFSLLIFATSFPLLCQGESIWLVGQVSWQALATGESVNVPKVLTGTQCAEDHAELLARRMEGGRVEWEWE